MQQVNFLLQYAQKTLMCFIEILCLTNLSHFVKDLWFFFF